MSELFIPETSHEAVFLLDGIVYLSIQACDSGFDYTLYDGSYAELDGGQLDDDTLSMTEAVKEILLMHGYTTAEILGFSVDGFEMVRSELAEL